MQLGFDYTPPKIDLDLGFGNDRRKPPKRSLRKIRAKKGRDSNRAFSKTQKDEILWHQDNKCAICHEKLDPRTKEFDHKRPWAAGGRTITVNGRALCANCHKIVTHNTRLKQVDRTHARSASKSKRRAENGSQDIFGLYVSSTARSNKNIPFW